MIVIKRLFLKLLIKQPPSDNIYVIKPAPSDAHQYALYSWSVGVGRSFVVFMLASNTRGIFSITMHNGGVRLCLGVESGLLWIENEMAVLATH